MEWYIILPLIFIILFLYLGNRNLKKRLKSIENEKILRLKILDRYIKKYGNEEMDNVLKELVDNAGEIKEKSIYMGKHKIWSKIYSEKEN